MEPFDTDEGRGSLLGVGQGGRLEMTEGKWLVRLGLGYVDVVILGGNKIW